MGTFFGLILGRIGKWPEVKKPGWVLYGRYLFLFVYLVLYPLTLLLKLFCVRGIVPQIQKE